MPNNRVAQFLAAMDSEENARKLETLTGVIAIGGYLREVAADEGRRDPKIDATARRIVADALTCMLGRAPSADEVGQVLGAAL